VFFTHLIPLLDILESRREQRRMSKLRTLMKAQIMLELELERYRRELALSQHNQNSGYWYKLIIECGEERVRLDLEIAKLLPSKTYEFERRDGFKRSK